MTIGDRRRLLQLRYLLITYTPHIIGWGIAVMLVIAAAETHRH